MSNHLRLAVIKGREGMGVVMRKDIVKWNREGERIELKLAVTYQKMGCIATVECYSVLLGEYSVELTNNRKLSATQKVTYNQLVHLMETHDMGKVNKKTGVVVSRKELDDDYNRCILSPNNGRHPGRPPSKRIESKPRTRKCAGAQNVAKLDIQGAHVAILEQISMQHTKVLQSTSGPRIKAVPLMYQEIHQRLEDEVVDGDEH
ncbi:hypothetical protein Cgig2_015727 [Carnegiea gigantea]|uniref:Uncharacterized protein n=1 Tax=Carnegiea gigantea TaxID=171969 RepID=A0A9Q1GUR9_9CARY|nr:hypothetical protein Cgig2_015727 [Carnegiea gigantea]